MTDASKLKKKIRARSEQTGESYSAARRQVLAKLDAERQSKTRATAQRAQQTAAAGAVSEQRCIEKTGHGFEHWFAVLDRFGARQAGHTRAARHLQQDHGVSAWYAQAITVAYERAHGLREVGQLCSGDYQTSVSRVLPVDLDTAVAGFAQPAERDRWLAEADGEPAESLRAALAESGFKSKPGRARLRYRPHDTVVELALNAKADGRSTVAVQHSKIAERAAMEELRAGWRQLLDAFRAYCRQL